MGGSRGKSSGRCEIGSEDCGREDADDEKGDSCGATNCGKCAMDRVCGVICRGKRGEASVSIGVRRLVPRVHK